MSTAQLLAGPQYWGDNLPQVANYDTLQAYQDALKSYHDAQPWAAPAFSGPPDVSSMGPGWHAAGVNAGGNIGQLAAHNFQVAYDFAHQPGVISPSSQLAMYSRGQVRPEEAANAYDAFYINDQGLPQSYMTDDALTAMEGHGFKHEKPGLSDYYPNLLPSQTDPNYVRDEAAKRQAVIDQYGGGGGNGGGSGQQPDWGVDDPALYNFYNSWGWQQGPDGRWGAPGQPPAPTSSGSVERPGVNDPVRQQPSPQQPVAPDQTQPGGPVERPHAAAMIDHNHQYPPEFLKALDALRKRGGGRLRILGY